MGDDDAEPKPDNEQDINRQALKTIFWLAVIVALGMFAWQEGPELYRQTLRGEVVGALDVCSLDDGARGIVTNKSSFPVDVEVSVQFLRSGVLVDTRFDQVYGLAEGQTGQWSVRAPGGTAEGRGSCSVAYESYRAR